VRLAAQVGSAEAGRRLGISDATIRSWIRRDAEMGLDVVRSMGRDVDIPDGLSWPERQSIIADRLVDVLEDVVGVLAESVAEGRARDAQKWMMTLAIGLDKARLVRGQASSISQTESRSVSLAVKVDDATARAEIAALRAEMGLSSPEIIDAEEVPDDNA
jgi:DNA-binding transcriptional regulator YiaG